MIVRDGTGRDGTGRDGTGRDGTGRRGGCAPHGTPTWAEAARAVLGNRLFVYLSCVMGAFLIFFLREPDPYLNPVLFTEDGSIYVATLIVHGFRVTLAFARPDYLVFGNVFLAWVATQVSMVLSPDDILLVPRVLALLSYLVFAVSVSLPVLLMFGRVRFPFLLIGWLVSAFVPLGQTGNEVLGRLGNVGFLFFYVAFVLIWYRNNAARHAAAFAAVDLGLLFCVYTNPMALLLLPMTAWPYLRARVVERRRNLSIVGQPSFVSLLALTGACAVPVVWICQGVPRPQEPLRSVLTAVKVVELGVARNILYPLVHPFYAYLNLWFTLAILVPIVFLFVRYGCRRHRPFYVEGGATLLLSTAVLVLTRPELIDYLPSAVPGPLEHLYSAQRGLVDRYFFAQNLIGILLLTVLASDFYEGRRGPRWARAMTALAFLGMLIDLPSQSSFGRPVPLFACTRIGDFPTTLEDALERRCFVDIAQRRDPQGRYVWVDSYPAFDPPAWRMLLPRDLVESSLARRRERERPATSGVEPPTAVALSSRGSSRQ